MSELKPCPFCGGDLVTRHTGWLDHPKAKCILSGKVFHKGFIGQWNRRAEPTLSAAMELPEVKALVEATSALIGVLEIASVLSTATQRIYIPRMDVPELVQARATIAKIKGADHE